MGYNAVQFGESATFRRGTLACRLFMVFSCLVYSSVLKLEAIRSSETLGSLQTVRRCKPEDCAFDSYRHENPQM
jgi:hypothetical protein